MNKKARQILNMFKLGEVRNFTVVSFNAGSICGGVFSADADGVWRLAATSSKKLAGAKDETALWSELWHELPGGGELIILTGAFTGGVLFSFETVALAPGDQMEALLMELPRQMLRPPADPVLQYLPTGGVDAEGMQRLNVYAFERKSMVPVIETLRRSRLFVDEFIHPLLTVGADDPPVFLPGIDPDFYFHGGKFHRASAEADRLAAYGEWRGIMERIFTGIPADCALDEFLPVFLIARFIVSGGFPVHRKTVHVLPDELRPVRFRRHLQLTAVLLTALIAVSIWNFSRGRWQDFKSYREVSAEIADIKRKTDTMQATLRRSAKEQKDIAKVLAGNACTNDIIGQFYSLSKLLPQDVMLTDLRWSESGIDIVLQSESENLDLPGVLRPLSNWKVTDINQRQGRFSATTTVTAKLVPADQGKGGKNGKKSQGTSRKGAKK